MLRIPDQDRRKNRQRDERSGPRRGMEQNAAAPGHGHQIEQDAEAEQHRLIFRQVCQSMQIPARFQTRHGEGAAAAGKNAFANVSAGGEQKD